VRLDIADDDIAAGSEFASRGFKHRVSFPHARRHAEEDLQLAAFPPVFFFLNRSQQRVGIGSLRLGHAFSLAFQP